MFNDSQRSRADKAHNCMSQLNTITASLEYWKGKQSDDNRWLLEKAMEFIERASKKINDTELKGIADLRD